MTADRDVLKRKVVYLVRTFRREKGRMVQQKR